MSRRVIPLPIYNSVYAYVLANIDKMHKYTCVNNVGCKSDKIIAMKKIFTKGSH